MDVVCNPFLTDPKMITEIAKDLAIQALNLGFKDVLADLGHSKVASDEHDEFQNVPQVRPVVKDIVRFSGLIVMSLHLIQAL